MIASGDAGTRSNSFLRDRVNQESAAVEAGETTGTTSAPGNSRPSASLRAVGLVSSFTVVQLLLQFATQLLMAKYYGTAGEVDAFMAAFALPIVIGNIVSGSLEYVLVPVVADALARKSTIDAARIALEVAIGVSGLSLAITVVVAALAQPFIAVLCPGFLPAEQVQAAGFLRILSVLVFGNCLTAYLNALYHAYRRFAEPAAAGVAGTLVTFVYVYWMHPQQGIYGVVYGVVAGVAVTNLVLLPLFVAQCTRGGWPSLAVHQGTRRCLVLLAPLVLGAIIWRLDPLVDRYLGSYLDQGSIAQMGYASRLTSGLMLIGTSGLAIVAFSSIAAHAAARRREALNQELAHALRFFLFLMVPICVGVSVYSGPVVRLLYEYGKFTVEDTHSVAVLLVLSVGVIQGAGLSDLLSRTFYAEHDTRIPVIVSIVTFVLAVGLKCLLVGPLGAPGIVAATSIYSLLNVVILGAILVRRNSLGLLAGTGGSLLRSVVGSTVACLAAAFVFVLPWRIAVLPGALVGAGVYVVVMWVLRDEFGVGLVAWFRARANKSISPA